jgi:ankyrin repeat protein
MTTLFEAIEAADVALLKQAFATEPDLNVLGDGQTTPLIEAARVGWLEGVRLLLGAGAEASWRDAEGETALLKAAANGHASVASVLSPLTGEDDADLARAFLAAFGSARAPEFNYDENRLKKKAVELAARAANFVGNEEPLARVNRVARAESLQNGNPKGRK